MFKFVRFLIWAIVISLVITWLALNNGTVVVTWFGYEIRTDTLTASITIIFTALLIFSLAYLLGRILGMFRGKSTVDSRQSSVANGRKG